MPPQTPPALPTTTEEFDSPFEASIATRYRVSLIREPTPEYLEPQPCSRPLEAASFVRRLLEDWDREVVGVILMNRSLHAIGHIIAYIGTLARTAVEPRGLLVPALLANAAGIILFHNHPGCTVTPSREDIRFCERLAAAGDIVGVALVDSLIVTPEGQWTSMGRLGCLPKSENSATWLKS